MMNLRQNITCINQTSCQRESLFIVDQGRGHTKSVSSFTKWDMKSKYYCLNDQMANLHAISFVLLVGVY